jgi:hypothetical protein
VSFLGRTAVVGLKRGVLRGQRGWLMVGVGATAVAALRKLLGEHETVYATELKPNEGIQVRVVKPPQ